MNKQEAIEKFIQRWPNATKLRREFATLVDFLQGEFEKEEFNFYPSETESEGAVISRPLEQGLAKNPTVGIIFPGKYSFEIGNFGRPDVESYNEMLTVLDGELTAEICALHLPGHPTSKLQKYGSIISPVYTTLILATPEEAAYLCQYIPKTR